MQKKYVAGTFLILLLAAGCQSVRYLQSGNQHSITDPGYSAATNLAYGSVSDIHYAEQLWQSLGAAKMVGPDANTEEPFFGGARPHGMILEIASGDISVNRHTGFVIVKKNYDGEGVSVAAVKHDRSQYLSSITVMYQREAHYDDDNQDWFWVKYKPDGTLFEKIGNGQRTSLAGRLMKAESRENNRGCIYCHSSAGGGDYVFYPSILVPDRRGEKPYSGSIR